MKITWQTAVLGILLGVVLNIILYFVPGHEYSLLSGWIGVITAICITHD